jgi:hypothetical protein
VRPHRDTEAVLSRLTEGAPVGVNRGGWTRYGDVADVGLDGVTVRWPDGGTETVVVHSAHQQDRVSPVELEVLS